MAVVDAINATADVVDILRAHAECQNRDGAVVLALVMRSAAAEIESLRLTVERLNRRCRELRASHRRVECAVSIE